jgi:hypothetical protein
VFRQDLSSQYSPYNAMSWYFMMPVDLPAYIELKIEILIPLKLKSYFMPGSLSHNLPGFFETPVSCTISGSIICSSVG